MEISLSELLLSRDNRQLKQRELIQVYKKTVLSLTIVMPGAVKKNALTDTIGKKAVEAVKEKFGRNIITCSEYDLKTGFEAFFVVSAEKFEAKRLAVQIEDRHALGRLFDIDVLGENGIPVSREEIGFDTRKCLICEHDARYCIRNKSHTSEEILAKIEEMVNEN